MAAIDWFVAAARNRPAGRERRAAVIWTEAYTDGGFRLGRIFADVGGLRGREQQQYFGYEPGYADAAGGERDSYSNSGDGVAYGDGCGYGAVTITTAELRFRAG